MSQLASYISDCSLASSYTTYNWHGSSTTENHIYDAAFGVGHCSSISYYIGHGKNDKVVWLIERHYEIVTDDGTWVADDWIHSHSACQNVRFVFLWSCHQGDTIGGTHFWSGPYGMPHCWLHTTNLSSDGYANPDNNGYTFIGFSGEAPGLTCPEDGFAGCRSYYFAGYFYKYALISGVSINEALDWAADDTWLEVDSFSNCILYNGFTIYGKNGKMVVYGDGNLEIGSAASTPPLPSRPPKYPPPPSGHSCPTLFVWNGTDYSEEGILDIHAESDITIQHRIEQTLIPDGITYKVRLWELDNFTSHIDQVRLYAVDGEGKWHKCLLILAEHSELGRITWEVRFDDENRVNLEPAQIIDLKFLTTIQYNKTVYFVFEINGYNQKPHPT
jgi:hypothetical protein